MEIGDWILGVSIEADGESEPPLLREVLQRAVRLGIEVPDRPIAFGLQPALEINVVLTDDRRIQELNRAYRGIDGATDVLSFSQIEGGAEFVPAPAGRLLLGDVIVSVETARRQAQEQGHSLDAELRHLAVHGALHLLGYDHETDEDEASMNRLALAALDYHA